MNDTIYRKDAIDAVISLCDDCDSGYCGSCRVNYPGEKDVRKVLEALPPAQPRKGKWIKIYPANIYECSVCGQNVMTNDIEAYKFCHGCGAEMKRRQE